MSVRRSARQLPRSNKVGAITSTLESLNRVVAGVGDADLSWMDEQLQFLYSRARNGGAPIISSTASDLAATDEAEKKGNSTTLEAEEARIESLLVRQLKAELYKAGESTDGRKCVLKERLLEVVRKRCHQQNEYITQGEDAEEKPGMADKKKNASTRDSADADPPIESSPMDIEQDDHPAPASSSASKSNEDAAIQSEEFMATGVERQSTCEMEIEVSSSPVSSSNSATSQSKQQMHSNRTDENDVRPFTTPLIETTQKAQDLPCSERKRDRSPTRESPSVLQSLSPNKSMTKAQKVSQWPQSASKVRGENEGDGKKAISIVPSQMGQSSDLRADHAAKPSAVYQPKIDARDKKDTHLTALPHGHTAMSTPNILPMFQKVLSSKVLETAGAKPSHTSKSVLSEDARKKNDDRKARLMDIRAKSKAVATTKQLVCNAASLTQTFSTFKSAGKTETSGAAENSAKLLNQQLSQKAKITAASSKLALTTTMMTSSNNAAPLGDTKPSAFIGLQKPSTMQALNPSTQACSFPSSASKKTIMSVAGVHKTQMTDSIKKALGASPTPVVYSKQADSRSRSPQTYEMSDEESVDSEDDEAHVRRAKKYVPQWARSPNLKALLEKQHRRTDVHPDEIFGRVTTCDLEAIFGRQPNKKYNVRSSTGDWAEDCIKPHEQLVQKRPCQV